MVKKKVFFFILLSSLIQFLWMTVPRIYAADYTIGSDGHINYQLVFNSGLNGYTLQVDDNGAVLWSSPNGTPGYRVIDSSNNVSPFLYGAYSTITVDSGKTVAIVTFNTPNGSSLRIVDTYSLTNGQLTIARDQTVLTANSKDKGYMTTLVLRSAAANQPAYYKWFAPSAWWGNDSDNFSDRSKFCFKNNTESSFSVDEVGLPIETCFDPSSLWSLTLMDKTPGRRETIAGDCIASKTQSMVSDRINLPGLGMRRSSDNHTELFHAFPGYTSNWRGYYNDSTVMWRFLPVTANSSRQVNMAIGVKSHPDFNTCVKDVWRNAYSQVAQIDDRFDVRMHFHTVADLMNNSFGVSNSGVPRYMNAWVHPGDDSGFLGRNADIASILLAYGYELNNQSYINNARTVLNDQVNTTYHGQTWLRARCDADKNVLNAYITDKAHGVDNTSWYNKVVAEADLIMSKMDGNGNLPFYLDGSDYTRNDAYMAISLMVQLYNYNKNAKYLKSAIGMGNYSWNHGHNTMRFRDGITDYGGGPSEHDRESAATALEAYNDLYLATNDSIWLNRAKVAADYLETWQVVQNINMEPIGCTGTENGNKTYNNSHYNPTGLSYINAGSNGVDALTGQNALDYYILYQKTNDRHYLDFAKQLLYNTSLGTDMDDKSGVIADAFTHVGAGWANEVLVIAPDNYTGWCTSQGRGEGHEHTFNWQPYELLTMVWRIKKYTGDYDFNGDTNLRSRFLDDRDPSISYSGNWTLDTWGNIYFNNTARGSKNSGDYFQITFNGTDINWYADMKNDSGKADVYIDNIKVGVADLYSSTEKPQQLVFKFWKLKEGSHTFKVVVRSDKNSASVNNWVNVDYLVTNTTKQQLVGETGIVVDNPGFENGDLSGWNTEPSNTAYPFIDPKSSYSFPHTGNYKGTIAGASGGAGRLYKTVTGLTAGHTYKAGAFIMAGNRNATFFVRNYGGNEIDIGQNTINLQGLILNQAWYYKEIVFIPSGTTAEIGLYAPASTDGSWACIDDLSLTEINPSTRYEAETATLYGTAVVAVDHPGYSGSGFVAGYWTQNAATLFMIEASQSGLYNLNLRYASGLGDKTVSLYVNGADHGQITCKGTTDWDTWSDIVIGPVSLHKGTNYILYRFDADDSANINLDYLDVTEL